jgi:hypothetical protein
MLETDISPEERLERAIKRQSERRDAKAKREQDIKLALRSPLTISAIAFGGLALVGVISALIAGVNSKPFDPDICRTESGRLTHVQQCITVLHEGGSWTHASLSPEKCKRYIGGIMSRTPSSMTTEASDNTITRISYNRESDGKKFIYECTTIGDKITWRGVDIFTEGEGPGRWREEDAKDIESI